MWSTLARGIITAAITVVIMSVVSVFIAGGNAWFGITPGALIMMFTYTNTVANQFNFINTRPAAHQPGLRRRAAA